MAAGIVRLTDPREKNKGDVWYCDWSTNCDSFRSPAMTYPEMVEYMVHEEAVRCFQQMSFEHCGLDEYEDCAIRLSRLKEDTVRRLVRLNTRGTTWMDNLDSGEASVKFNRCGPKEGSVGLNKLIDLIKVERKRQLDNEVLRQERLVTNPPNDRQKEMMAYQDDIAKKVADLAAEILALAPQPS